MFPPSPKQGYRPRTRVVGSQVQLVLEYGRSLGYQPLMQSKNLPMTFDSRKTKLSLGIHKGIGSRTLVDTKIYRCPGPLLKWHRSVQSTLYIHGIPTVDQKQCRYFTEKHPQISDGPHAVQTPVVQGSAVVAKLYFI